MNRVYLLIIAVVLATAEPVCTRYNVTSLAHPGGVDVMIFTSQNLEDVSDVVHCTTIWPNESPELAVYPVPPGCMRINPRNGRGLNVSNAMKIENELGRSVYVEWTPEWEFENHTGSDPARRMSIPVSPVLCKKHYSKTTFGSTGRVIIVGENCAWVHRDACNFLGVVRSSTTCAQTNENTHFLQPTGFHRSLYASISGNGRHSYDAIQWLPRQWFAEVDELERKTVNMSESLSRDVNIENPSAIAPAQVILVRDYPIPVHSRVNPPLKNGTLTHTLIQIPDAVWMSSEDAAQKDCSFEAVRLSDKAKVPPQHRLMFAKTRALVRTKSSGADRYVNVLVPTGKSEDLLRVVAITAFTAVGGALAIILASVI